MEIIRSFNSILILTLVFSFQSRFTVGQTNKNTAKPNLFFEVNPSLKAELFYEPHETYSRKVIDSRLDNEDAPEVDEITPDDDASTDSLEKFDEVDEDGSSEESGSKTSSTISTTFEPNFNESSSVLGTGNNFVENDIARLLKSIDDRKSENWYAVKRSANDKSSQGNHGTKGSKQKQPEHQRINQKGRNVGGNEEGESLKNNGDGPSPPGHVKHSGIPGHNKPSETPGHNKPSKTPGHNKPSETPGHNKPSETPGHNKHSMARGNNKTSGNPGHNKPLETSEHAKPSGTSGHNNNSATPRHNKPSGAPGHNNYSETPGNEDHPGTHMHNNFLRPPGHNNRSGTPGHKKPSGMPGHKEPSGPHGPADTGKVKNDAIANNKYAGVGQLKEDILVNKTSVHPFSVRRTLRTPVDPNVYSFFQFRPPQSIGFLWTQTAGLGGEMLGELDMLETETGFDDDLDPSIIFDWEFKRYDRACLYVENNAYKAQINSTQVTEDVTLMVDNQNEKLARRFLDWQFINKEDHETIALKEEGENHPHYLTYKFLTITMEIFRDKICRNATPYATTPEVKPFAPVSAPLKAEANKKHLDSKLLPKSFIDDLYRLFLTLRDITLPKGVPDYASKKDEQDIYTDVLDNCLKLDPIQWYSHSCADQVLSYDDPHNYACTPFVEYDFNVKEYDPILDGMWHMFTAVHGFCFEEFDKISTRLWHKYSMIIANSFTVGMRARWKASIAEPKFYRRLLGPDYKTHLETMNRCMFAATLRSGAPSVLPRLLSVAPLTFERERTIGKDAFETHPKS